MFPIFQSFVSMPSLILEKIEWGLLSSPATARSRGTRAWGGRDLPIANYPDPS